MRNALAIVLAALALSACGPIRSIGTPKIVPEPVNGSAARFCAVYEPISYSSKRDTPETVEGVRRENGKWTDLCTGLSE
jgi:hypothetical protein